MDQDLTLDELLQRWESLRGQPRDVTVEDLCADRPESASDVRERLRAVAAMMSFLGLAGKPVASQGPEDETRLRDPGGDDDGGGDATHFGPGASGTVDVGGSTGGSHVPEAGSRRFRRLRHHARGGLGKVSVALDSELNREVALKEMLDACADDATSRRRFLLEAEITGRLEHPGVVPVYGLGTYLDGRPYYAMRFVRGDSLKEVIEHFHGEEAPRKDVGHWSLELRKLLRRFLDVCNTIEYAHGHGVLHRDIKPGNIIVGKHGETLVIDWDLAKATGKEGSAAFVESARVPPSTRGGVETLPGSTLGTPAYMSPEQARGDLERIGPASDVYGLGATLYCILAGRPPFEGTDIGLVLDAVERGDLTPPRRHAPTIDRALEAICLKAMARQPEDRYSGARALAEDIERWLADEPVTAWREPWTRALGRWLGRHRTGVTAVMAAGLALTIGLGAVAVVQASARAALAAKNQELVTANARVRQRYNLAIEAIKKFHTGVSEDFLLKQDQFKELRDQLLKSAADFYGRLSTLLGPETDLASRRALALSNFELADLTRKIGRLEDALVAHRAVLAAREALAAERANDPAVQIDLSDSLLAVGSALQALGQAQPALSAYERAGQAVSNANGDPRDGDAAKVAFAKAARARGWLLHELGKIEGLRWLERARDIRAALDATAPDDPERKTELAHDHDIVGRMLRDIGEHDEAAREYGAARAILEQLVRDDPADTRSRNELAGVYISLGRLMNDTRNPNEALAMYGSAREILERLSQAHPAVLQYQNNLAAVHNNLGAVLAGSDDPSRAEPDYRRVLALYAKLIEANPASNDFRNRLALGQLNLGKLLASQGKLTEAEANYRDALALSKQLVKENPSFTDYRNRLSQSHFALGSLHARAGRPAEAEANYRAAMVVRKELADGYPEVAGFLIDLAIIHGGLGELLADNGRPAEAEAAFRLALKQYQKVVSDHPADSSFRADLASGFANLGRFQSREGKNTEAMESFRSAVSTLERLPVPTSTSLYDAACYQSLLAGAAKRLGTGPSTAEARDLADQAMETLRRAIAAGYRNAAHMRTDADLDPLRGREDFRLLMMDLSFPPEPFARSTEKGGT